MSILFRGVDIKCGKKKRTKRHFFKCTLGTKYMKVNNGLSTDPTFKTGVAKIQQKFVYKEIMNLTENFVCKNLLNYNLDTNESDSDDKKKEYDFSKKVVVGEKRKDKEVSGKSRYIDYFFILGTAACVQRLWSEGDDLITKRHKGICPITT